MAEVTVNEKTGKVNLNGTGEFSLELAEAYNEIYIRYTLDDPNTIYLLYFEKVVDNIPPMLRLPENKSAIRVDETEYILAGVTEPNAVVNVAGEEVSVNQDGTFVHKISLKYGENIIPVTATDAAGNITAQDIIIFRSSQTMAASTNDNGFWGKVLRYLPMILSFIGSVILIALGYIFTKIYDKNREISKPFAVVSLLRNVFLVLSTLSTLATSFIVYKYITINSIINSEKMFEAANNSITEAFKLMEDFALYKKWLVKGIIVTFITLGLFVGCMYMARMLRKRATEQDREDSKDDTVAETKKAESSESDLTADSVPVDDSTSIVDSTPAVDSTAVVDSAPAVDSASVVDSTPIVDSTDTSGKKTDLQKPEESSSKAIRCPRCGATYDKPVKFCGKCGTKIDL